MYAEKKHTDVKTNKMDHKIIMQTDRLPACNMTKKHIRDTPNRSVCEG